MDGSTTETRVAPAAEDHRWQSRAQRNKEGALRCNLANAMLALRRAPELRDVFVYDEMARSVILMKPLPGMNASGLPRPVRDDDVTTLQEWLQLAGLVSISDITIHHAVIKRARERAFHPVRKYLNGLRWDGKERLPTWLSTYLGAEQSDYTSAVGTMFLIQMVARVFEPGCKADYTLVLEDPEQGTAKSKACATLGGPWFSDSLPDLRGDPVRVSQHLRGKWLIELGELWALERAYPAELKAFLTRPIEQFTPKYARNEVHEPRQCCYIGTTNKQRYLRDETGARRFWPVRTSRIDTEALSRDRDQLFAEAVVRYRRGEHWWPEPDFEANFIKHEQDERFDADVWEGPIATYLLGRRRTTVFEIASDGLGIPKERITRSDQNRITAVLESLGWQRGKRSAVARPWELPDRCK